jgi:hypothetical protein
MDFKKGETCSRYFDILAEVNLVEALEAHISRREEGEGGPLDTLKRITCQPHATIVHA